MLDLGVALQHGGKISAKLGQSLFGTLFVLNNDIVTVLLKRGFSVLGVLDGAEMRIFDDGSQGLLPRPVWLNPAAPKEFDKGGLGLLLGGIFGLDISGDEGLGLDVAAKRQLARFTERLTVVAMVVVSSASASTSVAVLLVAVGGRKWCSGGPRKISK